jgi:hypothetical protein
MRMNLAVSVSHMQKARYAARERRLLCCKRRWSPTVSSFPSRNKGAVVLPPPLGSNHEGTTVVRARGGGGWRRRWWWSRPPTPLTRASRTRRTPRSGGNATAREASSSPMQVEHGEHREGAEDPRAAPHARSGRRRIRLQLSWIPPR